MLDFDDLLIFALRLFTNCPWVVENIEHVLVDEVSRSDFFSLPLFLSLGLQAISFI